MIHGLNPRFDATAQAILDNSIADLDNYRKTVNEMHALLADVNLKTPEGCAALAKLNMLTNKLSYALVPFAQHLNALSVMINANSTEGQ